MPAVTSAALILIDGLRPDALLAADAPTLHRLRSQGASTMSARTVMPSMSLPCHASLFYGVDPGRHGITSNAWHPMARPVPSMVDIIHAAGRRTAMFYNWEPLRDLAAPGSVDESHMIRYEGVGGDTSDRRLFTLARQWIEQTPDFGLVFLYYGWADIVGHEHRWMSPQYMDAIVSADRLVADVLPSLPPNCLLVVTADHGGHDWTHGTDCEQDMTIPLVLHGPGIQPGSVIEPGACITDVAPTVTHWLGLEKPREWIGRPLL